MNVQALCDKLVANDATLTELEIILDHVDDAELNLILDAAKNNNTVKKVLVRGSDDVMPLSVQAALALASVVSEHPEIQEIEFSRIDFKEFGPIALAIQQNRNLTGLRISGSLDTPNVVECCRWLHIENALESMIVVGNTNNAGELSFDIPGAL
jgi:hypothetical protein